MFQQSLPIFLGSLACLTSIGCSNVQVLRLTSETFSPRSVEEVAILSQEPSTPYIRIAELNETSSSSVPTLQGHILKKAAQLGADAVMFSPSSTRVEQRVDYQPVYSPWGYYAPYYYGSGPYGYWRPWGHSYGAWGPARGYGAYAAVPYSLRLTTIRGVAIRYTDPSNSTADQKEG